MNQSNLDFETDICRNHHGGDELSAAAHASIAPEVAIMRARILKFLENNPSTCEEVEVALGLRHQTASARLSELKAMNLVQKTGFKRPTESGRSAAVLAIS